jgi:hypothetical protein
MEEVNEFLVTDRGKDQETRQTQDAFDLLTLVNQSYQALDIGRLESIKDLRCAIEDVDSVRKHFTAKNSPSDTDSFGLASTINPNEELETYVRMVSFFNKRKPEKGICWELFEMSEGTLRLKNESEISAQELQFRQQEAVAKVIQALENAEALGLEIFRNFDSSLIYRDQQGYHAEI